MLRVFLCPALRARLPGGLPDCLTAAPLFGTQGSRISVLSDPTLFLTRFACFNPSQNLLLPFPTTPALWSRVLRLSARLSFYTLPLADFEPPYPPAMQPSRYAHARRPEKRGWGGKLAGVHGESSKSWAQLTHAMYTSPVIHVCDSRDSAHSHSHCLPLRSRYRQCSSHNSL